MEQDGLNRTLSLPLLLLLVPDISFVLVEFLLSCGSYLP